MLHRRYKSAPCVCPAAVYTYLQRLSYRTRGRNERRWRTIARTSTSTLLGCATFRLEHRFRTTNTIMMIIIIIYYINTKNVTPTYLHVTVVRMPERARVRQPTNAARGGREFDRTPPRHKYYISHAVKVNCTKIIK